jgi:hypothetical protein
MLSNYQLLYCNNIINIFIGGNYPTLDLIMDTGFKVCFLFSKRTRDKIGKLELKRECILSMQCCRTIVPII